MKRLLAIGIIVALLCDVAHAETWPSLETYVKWCVLIVKCKTEVEGNEVKYKVVEVWKGKYSPDLFYHRPPDGYIYTGTWHGNDAPTDGREVIFFFTNNNHPSWTRGKLLDHSTSFLVKDGKLIYASTNFGLRKEYTVEEFKKAILGAIEKQAKEERQTETTDAGLSARPHIVEEIDYQKAELHGQLAAPEFDARRRAAIALARAGDNSGVPMLIEAMSSLTNRNDRNNCVVALRIAKDPRSIPALIKATDDPSPYIRGIALATLGEMKATNAYGVIVSHLDDLERDGGCIPMPPAMLACHALGELGDARAIPHLVKALDQKYTQGQAARALGKLTGHDFQELEEWREWWEKEKTQPEGGHVRK